MAPKRDQLVISQILTFFRIYFKSEVKIAYKLENPAVSLKYTYQ